LGVVVQFGVVSLSFSFFVSFCVLFVTAFPHKRNVDTSQNVEFIKTDTWLLVVHLLQLQLCLAVWPYIWPFYLLIFM